MTAALSTDVVLRHRRRVRIALWVANAVVLHELAFASVGGLRLHHPELEHYGRSALLVLPAVLLFAVVPGRRTAAHNLLVAVALAPFIAIGYGLMGLGAVAGLMALTAAPLTAPGAPAFLIALLLLFGSATALWLGAFPWLLRRVAWLPPAALVLAPVWYRTPTVVARLQIEGGSCVVEAGLICLPSDPVLRIYSVSPIVPGEVAWWRMLDGLPSSSHSITLRQEGNELVVAFVTNQDPTQRGLPEERRIGLD